MEKCVAFSVAGQAGLAAFNSRMLLNRGNHYYCNTVCTVFCFCLGASLCIDEVCFSMLSFVCNSCDAVYAVTTPLSISVSNSSSPLGYWSSHAITTELALNADCSVLVVYISDI